MFVLAPTPAIFAAKAMRCATDMFPSSSVEMHLVSSPPSLWKEFDPSPSPSSSSPLPPPQPQIPPPFCPSTPAAYDEEAIEEEDGFESVTDVVVVPRSPLVMNLGRELVPPYDEVEEAGLPTPLPPLPELFAIISCSCARLSFSLVNITVE